MIINHNMMSMNANRAMRVNSSTTGKSVEKLSTGMRVNRAADDAAGLSISEKMRGQIRGLHQASRNAQDGISVVQTAEGALDEVHAMLQRMRELAVQARNDSNDDDTDRAAIQAEITALQSEISDIATSKAEFNGMKLLDGKFSDKVFQVGANAGQTLTVSISALSKVIGDGMKATVSTGDKAEEAISKIDASVIAVASLRSKLGAIQNRLEHTIKNVENSEENLQAAESRIRDTDMASEMSAFTKKNILTQASQAMLAQANQLPQQVLQLLR